MKEILHLPKGLALKILNEFYSIIREPGMTLLDLSGIVAKMINTIEDDESPSYVYDMIEAGKESLPRNWLSLVSFELYQTYKKKYTHKYISACLSKNSTKWSDYVFASFVAVLERHLAENNESFTKLIELT